MILTIWKKTDKSRNCLIKIDNSVWGSMGEKTLRTLFHYHLGSFDITESEAQFLQDELLRTAWNKLLDWLARQERSTTESRDFLKKHYFNSTIIEQCISEALKKDFIDDERYCRLLIESLLIRQKSLMQIKTKLIEKRLPSNLWEPVLAELCVPSEQKSILQTQAEKVYLRYYKLDKNICYEKCLTALYRKGFDLDDAREALARLVWNKP
jgi:SOS response regulatory protein OraA/RecX